MHFFSHHVRLPFSNQIIRLILFISLCCLVLSGQAQQKTITKGLEVLESIKNVVDNAEKIKEHIDNIFEKVTTSNAYKTVVDGKSISFPYGILPDNGNRNYAIVVNSINLDPVAGMTAEMYMKIPYKSGKYLYFMADKVPLSKSGQLLGDLNLFLVESIAMGNGKGYELTFKGLDNVDEAYTYVTFSCKGFEELFINGNMTFNKDAVNKHNEPTEPVSLDFFINADRVANMIIEFNNVPDLEFKKLPGFRCSVPKLTLDYSDERNASNFNLPQWYIDSMSVRESDLDQELFAGPLWEGVYIPRITIDIPKSFKEGGDTNTVVIESKDLIVDQEGISALVEVVGSNTTPIVSGNLKGFEYDIDSIQLNVIASTLSKAGMYGDMVLPIAKKETPIGYGLTITQSIKNDSELEYHGYARVDRTIKAKAFGLAEIELESCKLEFEYKNKQFYPSTTLNGSLVVAPKKKNSQKASGQLGITFTELIIGSKAPYIGIGPNGSIGMMSGNASTLGKLPVSISKGPEIISENGGQRMGLHMGLTISLQGSKGGSSTSANGFGGEAVFTLWANRSASKKDWRYDGFTLSEISVEAEGPAYALKGQLSLFEDDPVYGKGFCGMLDLKVINKIEVKGSAIFGRAGLPKEAEVADDELVEIEEVLADTSYRYWFIDVAAKIPSTPLFPGVNLNGFSGGLYYNMEMLKVTPTEKPLCATATGRSFVPRRDIFGLMAGIGIEAPGGGNAYNGNINFGLEIWLNGGGLKRIATWGGVEFMDAGFKAPNLTELNNVLETVPAGEGKKDEMAKKDPPSAQLAANWYVEYDFPNKTLTGDFEIFINTPVVTGLGDNKSAGRISIYSSPDNWYLYIGRPVLNDMIGVNVLNVAKIGGYLCLGSILPDPPIAAMPPEIAPSINIDYNLLNVGGGFSFGARLRVEGSPGIGLGLCRARVELKYLILAGFDILLSKANEPVYCQNVEGERGFKGWYATGQAYFYGEAGLRAKWDCFLGKGSAEILSLFIKAYVFAQLPKPSYFAGEVSAGFKVVGKRFKKSFKLEVGDQCRSVADVSDVNFIAAITPTDGQTEVGVSDKIEVYFSKPLEKFEYRIQNGPDNNGIYRGYCDDEYVTVVSAKGQKIPFEYQMSEDFTQMTITPRQVMPENEKIIVEVIVVTQIDKGKQDWENTEKTEVRLVTFTTSAQKDYIPTPDVYYAYPFPDMENFYTEESRKGYVRLSVLPDKAVKLHPDYEFSVAFYDGNNEIDRTRNVSYSNQYGGKNFTFDLPVTRLEKGKKYTFKILKTPKQTFTTQTNTQQQNTTTGTVDNGYRDTTILSYDIRTSKYATFQEKMALYSTSVSEVFQGVMATELSWNEIEGYDEGSFEPLSDAETKGLIVQGIQVSNSLIQFGKISYNNASVNNIENLINTISSVDLRNNNVEQIYTTATSLFNDLNSVLKDVNLDCLLEGGCSQDELEQVKIPKGKFTLPIGYYLPGETTALSNYNIVVDLDEDLVIPF